MLIKNYLVLSLMLCITLASYCACQLLQEIQQLLFSQKDVGQEYSFTESFTLFKNVCHSFFQGMRHIYKNDRLCEKFSLLKFQNAKKIFKLLFSWSLHYYLNTFCKIYLLKYWFLWMLVHIGSK